ncbi:MAG: TetR/AcrR family transcriptional regulator [Bacteroidetes bacterium]|nr:TetR/AcrR family transcriptional regulator [Bacteroidota bacterium]
MQKDKKEQVIETTLLLIASQSIQATPMSQIAKVSGVAIGTIYHHFKSKEDILKEIYLRIKQDFQEIIESQLSESKSTKENFDSIWLGLHAYYIINPLKFLFLQQVTNSPAIDEETKKKGEKHYQAVILFFEKGIQEGVFQFMSPVLMAELVHGIITTMVELELNSKLEEATKERESALVFSWNAVKNSH